MCFFINTMALYEQNLIKYYLKNLFVIIYMCYKNYIQPSLANTELIWCMNCSAIWDLMNNTWSLMLNKFSFVLWHQTFHEFQYLNSLTSLACFKYTYNINHKNVICFQAICMPQNWIEQGWINIKLYKISQIYLEGRDICSYLQKSLLML